MNFNITYVLDFAIMLCMTIWFIIYEKYWYTTNDGLGLQENPTREQMFLDEVITNIDNHSFYFDYLLAATVTVYWFRFLLMLKLTQTFGPTIEIIFKMAADMVIFFGIWVLTIITLASIGMLIFSEIKAFDNL